MFGNPKGIMLVCVNSWHSEWKSKWAWLKILTTSVTGSQAIFHSACPEEIRKTKDAEARIKSVSNASTATQLSTEPIYQN